MKRVDWKVVQSRLRAGELALQEAQTPSPQRVQEAFDRRAVRLASTVINATPASSGLLTLVFRLAQERYAIELKELAEVTPFTRCVPVPGGPRRFLGVINLRGELRPVLDLGNLIGASDHGDRDSGFVLMLRRSENQIGMKVDNIEELREIPLEELVPPPHGSCGKGLVSATLTLLDVDLLIKAALSKEESRIT